MGYLGAGVSPGNVPIHHSQNNKLRVVDKRVKVMELVLRCLISCVAVLAALLVYTDSQVKVIFPIRKEAKFTDLKALVFLVVANGIVAAYSVVQLLRCVFSMARGTFLLNRPLAWAIFSGDQLIAYLSIAAVTSSIQAGQFSKLGQPGLQWMKVCTMYGKFCNQVGEGIAAALVASIGMAVISAVSAFSLFRLYGEIKKNKNSRKC